MTAHTDTERVPDALIDALNVIHQMCDPKNNLSLNDQQRLADHLSGKIEALTEEAATPTTKEPEREWTVKPVWDGSGPTPIGCWIMRPGKRSIWLGILGEDGEILEDAQQIASDHNRVAELERELEKVRDERNQLDAEKSELGYRLLDEDKAHADFRNQNDREWRAKLDHVKARAEKLEARVDDVVKTYDDYRGRGVQPAPSEYGRLVTAIEAARDALNDGKETPSLMAELALEVQDEPPAYAALDALDDGKAAGTAASEPDNGGSG